MNIPTLQEIEARLRASIDTQFGNTPGLDRRVLNAITGVLAAEFKLLYIATALVQKNNFPDTADSELVGGTLQRFGRVKLERNPFPASQGVFTVNVTGQAGGVIAQGLIFRANNGELYTTEQTVTLSGTNGVITVRSVNGGSNVLLAVGETITATEPIVNVNSEGTVATVDTAPQDAETLEQYRALVLQAYRTEPQGGAAADYRVWATDAQGIARVFPFAGDQAGVLNIYAEGTNTSKVPETSTLDALTAVLNQDPDTTKPLSQRGRRPISAWDLNVLAVTPISINVTINGLQDRSTTVVNTIQSALRSYFETIRPHVGGADDPNRILDTVRLGEIVQAITNSLLPGNFFDSVTMQINSNTVTSRRFVNGDIPVLGTLTTPEP